MCVAGREGGVRTTQPTYNQTTKSSEKDLSIENRIYREELKESLGMNFLVPFSLKGSSKCTDHVNVHKLYAVEYINTVCSLDNPFQFRIL